MEFCAAGTNSSKLFMEELQLERKRSARFRLGRQAAAVTQMVEWQRSRGIDIVVCMGGELVPLQAERENGSSDETTYRKG